MNILRLCHLALWLLPFFLGALPSLKGQGTVEFKNYFWHFEGTNSWREDRPIFLGDAVTRAAGSNVIVELWVRNPVSFQMEFVQQTHLLDGEQAGLFDGGYLQLLPVLPGAMAVIEVRAWDETSGTNYDSSLVKGATAFENGTGGWGLPPTTPQPLTNFHSFCLNNTNCLPWPAAVDFTSDYFGVSGALALNEFIVASTATSKTVQLHRSGELTVSTTVTYATKDGTATNGVDYLQQAGSLTFPPYETIRTFEIPILSSLSTGRVGFVNLEVRISDGMASHNVCGVLWILGDRATRITRTFINRPGTTDGVIYLIYCRTNCVVNVEASNKLDSSGWQTIGTYEHFEPTMPVAPFAPDYEAAGIPQRFYRISVE